MCVCMWMWVCVCVCACVCVCVCVSVSVFAGVHALAWARMCSSGWWNDLWCRVARVRVTSEGFSLSFILLLMWNDFTWGKIYNVGETFQREGSSGAASVLYTYRTNRLDYDSCFKTLLSIWGQGSVSNQGLVGSIVNMFWINWIIVQFYRYTHLVNRHGLHSRASCTSLDY